MTASNGLVSVIIPSYNQAQFLGQAIESVLRQSYPHFEIIVVDDGSTDNTLDIAEGYPGVHSIRQDHQGTSAARNRGIRESTGQYLVFLDSDDRLLPHALGAGIRHLVDHADCAFVFGQHREIDADGSSLSTANQPGIKKDHYQYLLLSNYVCTPATAMFRRAIFESVAGFDPAYKGAEDYDLYLRIARSFPIFGHGEIVAEYRLHSANTTGNNALMLRVCLAVLRQQRPYVRGNKEWEKAYRTGIKNWQRIWGQRLISQLWARIKEGKDWERSLRDIMVLLRYSPDMIARQLGRKIRRGLEAGRNNKDTVRSTLE